MISQSLFVNTFKYSHSVLIWFFFFYISTLKRSYSGTSVLRIILSILTIEYITFPLIYTIENIIFKLNLKLINTNRRSFQVKVNST